MKETLNQDTEPHESCQQLSWRRGMRPSVAAYEWLTDSQCCWHKLKKCEEVVKISAAARCIAWKPASVKDEQTQIRCVLHSSLWRFTELRGGIFFFVCVWVLWNKINSHYNTSVTPKFMLRELFASFFPLNAFSAVIDAKMLHRMI